MSTGSRTLQEEASDHEFFNLLVTETLALFEHLDFGFLTEYDAFAPVCRGVNTEPRASRVLPRLLALLLQGHRRLLLLVGASVFVFALVTMYVLSKRNGVGPVLSGD